MAEITVKKMCAAMCAAVCAVSALAMPSREELKKVEGVVKELLADDFQAMKAGKLASCVAPYFDWLNKKFGSTLPKGWVFRPPTQADAPESEFSVPEGVE